MKCLIINGGPRRMNTWTLVEECKKSLSNLGDIIYDEINLKDINLPMCNGCFNCIIYGENKCPHSKIMTTVIEKIQENDLLIITSPVYSLAITALLKNFIDHMSFNYHRPRYYNKRAIVFSTTAGSGAKSSVRYVKDVLMHWGFNRVYTMGIACYTDKDYQPNDKVKAKIEKIAKKTYRDVVENRIYKPSWKRIMYYNMWRGLSQIESYEQSADHRYWKDTDMVNRSYYEGISVPFYKRAFGRMLFSIIKKQFRKK